MIPNLLYPNASLSWKAIVRIVSYRRYRPKTLPVNTHPFFLLIFPKSYFSDANIQLLFPPCSSKPIVPCHFPSASIDIDMCVAETAHGEHHAVGVKGCASDGARLCGREEGGVGLDGVDACAVDVEEGEGVIF